MPEPQTAILSPALAMLARLAQERHTAAVRAADLDRERAIAPLYAEIGVPTGVVVEFTTTADGTITVLWSPVP